MAAFATQAASRPSPFGPAPTPQNAAPAGTFHPGTKVQVGSHRVVVEKYLSEGGFAHVYVVRMPPPDSHQTAVLKRVAVPDKQLLAEMRTEVETMKKLKGHTHIVTYIDSHASQLPGGGYEVFLLMEFCEGGGLIDFMNTRLKNRLTEPEILEIFSDAAEGVACMHYLKPPLLHRDLKVENILISKDKAGKKMYKLCDFGSTAPPRPAATNVNEGRLIEEDVQRHTTLQYRSPEMIDVYRKRPIDEKSDVWALGVLLYKLCYYTTPFEEQGQMAILSASFKYPAYPPFSDRLKKLVAMMLSEDPSRRPNIYQIVKEVCSMRGKEVPIRDIYASRTQSEARNNLELPPREPQVKTPPMLGASVAPPEQKKQYIPEVTPMRRGRPTAPGQQHQSGNVSRSPGKPAGSDPFAALDSRDYHTRAKAVDELAGRYPAVEQFSLLQDGGSKFQFDGSNTKPSRSAAIQQQVTDALADEAFAKPDSATSALPKRASMPPSRDDAPPAVPRASSLKKTPNAPSDLVQSKTAAAATLASSQPRTISKAAPVPPQKPAMVSVGTMTSDPPSPTRRTVQPAARDHSLPNVSDRPVWRVPDKSNDNNPPRLSSLLKFDAAQAKQGIPEYRDVGQKSPNLYTEIRIPKSPVSSRPSLEHMREPSFDHASRPELSNLHRSSSADARRHLTGGKGPSPAGSDNEGPSRKSSLFRRHHDRKRFSANLDASAAGNYLDTQDTLRKTSSNESASEGVNISSNVDFLKSMEEQEPSKMGHKRSLSRHAKRTSLPGMSKMAGRFGDAFKKFESGRHSPKLGASTNLIDADSTDTLRPLADRLDDIGPESNRGSESAQMSGALPISDYDEEAIDETEDLSPEVRRELERRRLSQEEKRVADAAAAYRQRLLQSQAAQGSEPSQPQRINRATAIQSRVKSLLDETGQTSPVKRTAVGYGQYTDEPTEDPKSRGLPRQQTHRVAPGAAPVHAPLPKSATAAAATSSALKLGVATSQPPLRQPIPVRPSAPPKPIALRRGTLPSPTDARAATGPNAAPGAPQNASGAQPNDDISDFEKKYPSLSLEMVETEIGRQVSGRHGGVSPNRAAATGPAAPAPSSMTASSVGEDSAAGPRRMRVKDV